MQVDWEHAAKGDADGLDRIAQALRERTRRAMLLEFAPTSVQNDWAEDPLGSTSGQPTHPLDRLHPICAQGIVELIDDPARALEHRAWLNLYRVYPSIRATAALAALERPIPTGA